MEVAVMGDGAFRDGDDGEGGIERMGAEWAEAVWAEVVGVEEDFRHTFRAEAQNGVP